MNEEQKDIGFKVEDKGILPKDPTLLPTLQEISAFEREHGLVGVSILSKDGKVLTREVAEEVLGTLRRSVVFFERFDQIPVAPSRPNPLFTRHG